MSAESGGFIALAPDPISDSGGRKNVISHVGSKTQRASLLRFRVGLDRLEGESLGERREEGTVREGHA